MIHLPSLISDLGFILLIGALVTLLFKKLKQPLVLGYLIAGFLVSPHVPWLPTVQDKESISVWSEIGVIFLLFSLGLEFSFKKLVKVGGSAGFTAVFEVLFMVGLGYLVGRLIGWNSIDSLFMGGILSVSSTTIIVRAFQELGMKGSKFVELVFGILVVEDVVAVLLLVLLPSLVSSEGFSVTSLLGVTTRMVFLILLWFILGIFLLPAFLRKIRDLLDEETTLVVAIGLCLVMVIIATSAGFSPALGAFVMGSLLAETPEGHHIEKLFNPIKNLFAAIFFVSVGMMIDPKVIVDHWGLVALFTAVTIFGKFISTYLGALISGQSRKTSVQAGMSLAQIGEFSFIIASLGVTLKVTSDFLYPLAVAASAVTTFTTPYMIKSSDVVYRWSEKYVPERIRMVLDSYNSSVKKQSGQGVGGLVLSHYGVKILLNAVIIVAVIFSVKKFVLVKMEDHFSSSPYAGAVAFLVCLLLSIPFFWGLVQGRPDNARPEELHRLKGLLPGITLGRVILAVLLLSVMVGQFISLPIASGVLAFMVVVAVLLTVRYGEALYAFFEKRFLSNLTEKEKAELKPQDFDPQLLPWNASVEIFDLGVETEGLIGKSLRELSFKENWGVTIASVIRGDRQTFAPGGDFVLWPYDRIVCFGSEEELKELHKKIVKDQQENRWTRGVPGKYSLSSFEVFPEHLFDGKSIAESRLREERNVLVVGVERGAEKILGPSSSFVLRRGDLVWVVSE
ncbi:cation:proton antiporter [Bdellovibrio svalbardensis]|uniref:Cation:proton antiporter n=1 Tax=Bdellovibrio svalbardensis TaxID=2972972 RepID=A0ABT6DI62_9BACT|nr:cation:proton antiporter [Bdellovibrio svalbardensis]MDG0816548.1 cation:proton antiporter [Bdellovibrio svalbardensis]